MKFIDTMETRFKKWLNRKIVKGLEEVAEDIESGKDMIPELFILVLLYCSLNPGTWPDNDELTNP